VFIGACQRYANMTCAGKRIPNNGLFSAILSAYDAKTMTYSVLAGSSDPSNTFSCLLSVDLSKKGYKITSSPVLNSFRDLYFPSIVYF